MKTLLALCGLILVSVAAVAEDWFDCVLPGDDDSPGLISWASLNGPPGAPLPRISVLGSRFVDAQGNRVRLVGTNISVFPRTGDEAAVAGRLAKFGFNIVRFHHLDADWNDNLFHAAWGQRAVELDPQFLERYDRVRAALANRGIYSNVNLLTGRSFKSADGLPAAVDTIEDWKVRQALGFWYRPVLDLQKDFARRLLEHRSVVNGLTLAEDPSVAVVEINNEAGLVQSWLSGSLEDLPDELLQPLRDQWNLWVRGRYSSRQDLVDRLGFSEGAGKASLVSQETHPLESWTLEQHGSAKARKLPVPGPHSSGGLRIDVSQGSRQGWHVQLNLPGLVVEGGTIYHLSFQARAQGPRRIEVGVMMAHDPWQSLAPGTPVPLSTQWKRFDSYFFIEKGDGNSRINFGDLGRQAGWIEVADVTLVPAGRPLGADQDPVKGTLALVAPGGNGYPRAYLDEWVRFLAQTERTYWEGMRDFLVNDLGVKAVVIPTILGCTSPEILTSFPAIDAHAYWNHPVFPGTPWDPKNWYVTNAALVRSPEAGTIGSLALFRIEGKPFTVSEYDHPFPNAFGSESYPILGAYAAFQDWDGIYSFVYDSQDGEGRFPHKIHSYFDQAANPVKMAGMLLAVGAFRRGDVAPARSRVLAGRDPDVEVARLAVSGAWNLGNGRDVGLDPRMALIHRTAQGPTSSGLGEAVPPPPYQADTGQLTWDPSGGQVFVDTPLTKIVTGFLSGQTITWADGIQLLPGPAEDHVTWGLTVKEGSSFSAAKARILVTGLGTVRNQGQNTKVYGGRPSEVPTEGSLLTTQPDFGAGPVQMKGVSASLALPLGGRTVQAWVLDFRGTRLRPLVVEERQGMAWVKLSGAEKALWYEIEIR